MAYQVPPLPYDYDALEPHIDAQTMQIHHDKHHQAYVDKVNAALEGTDYDGKPIEDVLKDLGSLPSDKQTAVRNNGGGHYNHTLFWESMSPDGGGAPDGALAEARSPDGSPPPSGLIICQKRLWLKWPPPLLRTGFCLSSGRLERSFSTSSTSLSAHSVPSSAALALST